MAVTKTSNRVIEGDDIEEQIAALPELMYLTRTNPNNPAIWETYNPKTGEIVDTGVFEGGGDQGLLAASRPVLALAASVLGAPYLSEFIAGQTGLTGSALTGATGATIGGGSTALTGGSAEDIARAALTGGVGGYIGAEASDLLKANTPIDASGMTQSQFDASLEGQLVKDMQNAGLTNNQISAFLDDMGIGQGLTVPSTTAPTVSASTVPELTVTAPVTPATNLSGVISALSNNVPTVEIKSERPQDTSTPTLLTPSATVPEVTVTSTKPVVTAPTTIPTIVPTTPLVLPTIPVSPPTPPAPPTPPTPPDKTPSITDILKVIGTVATIGGVANSVTPPKTTFPIVPVPEDWKTPPKTGVAPFTPLTPIDFGNRNMLIGTQWEKFLDPNYGKVPEPVQYSQPSNMSYNDLMGILGNKQGYPSASSLSINDIISGIQNQYGQANPSAMG